MKSTMRAAQGKDYGPVDEMVHVVDNVPVPSLEQTPVKDRKDWAIIRTLAVALAPGDVRVLSGKTRELQGPPSFPYILGGDVCGQIVQVGEGSDFQEGDVVCARFHEKPMGAMGEYALIHTGCCDRIPSGMTPSEAAALGSSGTAAVNISKRIHPGERVLVLGAGGGVGSHFCQLARQQGASFIAGVARDPARLLEKPILCDVAVDYTKEDAFARKDFSEQQFDVVVDFAGVGWLRLLEGSSVVKSASQGGRYLTCATEDPWFTAHGIWDILKIFVFTTLWRACYSRVTTRRRLPTYSFVMALSGKREIMTETLGLVRDHKLVPCVDPAGPFPFTTEGVRAAMKLQESRHGRGKVVVKVADL